MTGIGGIYYPPGSSRPQDAELRMVDGAVTVQVDGCGQIPLTPWEQTTVSARIGNTPRFISFADGSKFETDANDAIDRLLGERHGGNRLIHRLESRWRWAVVGVIVILLFGWSTIRFGIPAAARYVAFVLPPAVDANIGRGVLKAMDGRFLLPSEINPNDQQRLRRRFLAVAAEVAPNTPISIVFRKGGKEIGANAFALPSGTVVFTDQLVRLADNDEELEAVFAHELGHVVNRHGLRQTLQASMLSLVAMGLFGDVSSASQLIASVPLILTQTGYSRDFEREADAYALDTLHRIGVSPRQFAAILSRLEKAHCEHGCKHGSLAPYLSTHPPTEERLQLIRRALNQQ